MAKKLPAIHADGMTVQLTPNQFMPYKMGKKVGSIQPQGRAALIVRVGHFSIGVYGIRYPEGARTYQGKATDLVAMREYEDLGTSLESLQAQEEAGMKAYGKAWGTEHAHALLRRAGEYKRMLADMDGHPLEAELLADMAAVADICNEFLSQRREKLLAHPER